MDQETKEPWCTGVLVEEYERTQDAVRGDTFMQVDRTKEPIKTSEVVRYQARKYGMKLALPKGDEIVGSGPNYAAVVAKLKRELQMEIEKELADALGAGPLNPVPCEPSQPSLPAPPKALPSGEELLKLLACEQCGRRNPAVTGQDSVLCVRYLSCWWCGCEWQMADDELEGLRAG